MSMLLKSIHLTNFLSFGPNCPSVELRSLNVIIGPNGSGKSNLLEAIDLLRCTPGDLTAAVRDGGGVREWLWKGDSGRPEAQIESVVAYSGDGANLRFVLGFGESGQRFEIVGERIERENPDHGQQQPYSFYKFGHGRGMVNVNGYQRNVAAEDIAINQSILSQRKDPDQYPEITWLGNKFSKIRLYREWSFGRFTAPRSPQKTDLPNDFLEPDCSNLGLVLSKLQGSYDTKLRLLKELQTLYPGISDFNVQVEGGTAQVFFQERVGDRVVPVPATRLSDGTLRYLCLLCILLHPTPPPLVCIEEPELGLHPDVLPALAQLLVEASARTQLIVTTHSEVLVNAMSERPEAVLVADKDENGTILTRLDAAQLKPWLERYRLGQLWTRGDLGGTRW